LGGVSLSVCTSGQYAGCESRCILKFYRAWVNTIPSGNKPAAHYEWQQMLRPYDQSLAPAGRYAAFFIRGLKAAMILSQNF